MKSVCDRAFKEWALSCEAMLNGEQILLVRKGGIREEGGVFEMNDPEFFLMPTYEHQKTDLLQPQYHARLSAIQSQPRDTTTIHIEGYAVVDTIREAKDEAQVLALSEEHLWNEAYVKMRFEFNPYDPLFLILLRIYRLPEPILLLNRPEYGGCKSWVTLDRSLSTAGANPVLTDAEFALRRDRLLTCL